jgi:hypothetical protein
MNDLIERLEKATDANDRNLDLAIYEFLGAKPPTEDRPLYWTAPGGGPQHYESLIPDYTGSIDNALTLVPTSAQWSLEADTAWVRWMGKDDVEEAQGGFNGREGTCTALALCIAAIKARVAINNQRQSGRMSP